MMHIDLCGKRFGSLTVTDVAPTDGCDHRQYYCYCDCGSYIVCRGDTLTSGWRRTCGCGIGGRRKRERYGREEKWISAGVDSAGRTTKHYYDEEEYE